MATYPVPGASNPENAQFRSGQVIPERTRFTPSPPCGIHKTCTSSCMMRANDGPVVFSAQCCSRYKVDGLQAAWLGSLESLGRPGRSSWWAEGPQRARNGYKIHLGRTKVAREGSVPVGHLAVWAPETNRAIIDEALT